MKCPKCRTETLRALVVDDTEVDRCRTCDGIWFDPGELGSLLDSNEERLSPLLAQPAAEGAHDQRAGCCPRHPSATMLQIKSMRNREVAVETCPLCRGIWLDGGEFLRIREKMPHLRLGDLV